MRFVTHFVLGTGLFVACAITACGGGSAPASDTADGGGDDTGEGGASGDDGGTSNDGATKGDGGTTHQGDGAACTPPCRDWATYPAIAVVPHASELLAVSDVHGGYDRLVPLLAANGVIAASPASPSAAKWTGGTRVLVIAGDLFDKGPKGLEVIELLMTLEPLAAAQGGKVVTLLGNHEAEFFADPSNSKATATDGVDVELSAMGIAPQAIASGADPRGAWLLMRPVGAMVGKWFFSHAGDTHGMSVSQLESLYEAAIPKGYADPVLTGTDSILESRSWYTGSTVTNNAAALGALHIVFGHDPNALGAKGAIATASSNTLLRIDCGMSPDVNYSTGALLHVHVVGANDVVEQLDASGQAQALFTSPTGL